MIIQDNYDAWVVHDYKQEQRLQKLPECKCCGYPIQQDKAIRIDGAWYCEDCEDEAWKRLRKDYLEDID